MHSENVVIWCDDPKESLYNSIANTLCSSDKEPWNERVPLGFNGHRTYIKINCRIRRIGQKAPEVSLMSYSLYAYRVKGGLFRDGTL